MELRQYQQDVCDKAWNWLLKNYDSCLLELCTAAGKSFILAELAHRIHIASGKKVLILAPTGEIVKQNREKYLLTGEPCSIFSASAGEKCTKHPVIFGSPLTVKNNLSITKNLSAVFIDEAHMMSKSITDIIDRAKENNPKLRVVGVTGTPYRLGTGYIYSYDENDKPVPEHQSSFAYFDRLICSVQLKEMIESGYLVPPVFSKSETGYKTDALTTNNMGSYTGESINECFVGRGRKTSKIIEEVVNLSASREVVMIFAASIDHAKEILASLPEHKTRLVVGDTKSKEREEAINLARGGRIKYLISVGALTTGVDIPAVDTIAVLRATESLALFYQIIGRGLRLADNKKDCLVMDYAENLDRHCPDDDIFSPDVKAHRASDGELLIKAICENPSCKTENIFKGRKNTEDFLVDENGYFVDLLGERVKEEETGQDYTAHYGRRCYGRNSQKERCWYRWSRKECHECEYDNDIAARKCKKCGAELVDPNDKLVETFKQIKSSASTPTSDKLISWHCDKYISKAGNDTLRISYTTSIRSFTVWHMPAQRADWKRLNMAVFGKVAPDVDTFLKYKDKRPMPTTITPVKEGKFFRVTAYNQPETTE